MALFDFLAGLFGGGGGQATQEPAAEEAPAESSEEAMPEEPAAPETPQMPETQAEEQGGEAAPEAPAE